MFARIVTIVGVSMLLAGGTALDDTAYAQAIDVSNESVVCNSFLKTSLKISPPLTLGGTTPTVLKVKGKLGGCTATGGVTIPDFKSSVSGEISLPTNDCLMLSSASATGTLVVKWKANQKIEPATSTITISAGDLTGAPKMELWGGQYLYIGLGVNPRPSGMAGTALAVSGAFTGGDGGAASTADLVSFEDSAVFLSQCSVGNKAFDIAIGQLKLQ